MEAGALPAVEAGLGAIDENDGCDSQRFDDGGSDKRRESLGNTKMSPTL